VFTKIFITAAILFGVAVGVAVPAGADPSSFGVLSCNCEGVATAVNGAPGVKDQVKTGIENGFADLQGIPGLPG
jgi:hypothetical protein